MLIIIEVIAPHSIAIIILNLMAISSETLSWRFQNRKVRTSKDRKVRGSKEDPAYQKMGLGGCIS